jgi:hypothetical protein
MLESLMKRVPQIVNWQYYLYKAGLIVALLAGWSYYMYDKGYDRCQLEHSEGVVEQIVADVNKRLPVVQQAETAAAELRTELRTIREKLDEEATKPSDGHCGLSDSELQLYREAAAKTRR